MLSYARGIVRKPRQDWTDLSDRSGFFVASVNRLYAKRPIPQTLSQPGSPIAHQPNVIPNRHMGDILSGAHSQSRIMLIMENRALAWAAPLETGAMWAAGSLGNAFRPLQHSAASHVGLECTEITCLPTACHASYLADPTLNHVEGAKLAIPVHLSRGTASP
jgi:hypothetical protein